MKVPFDLPHSGRLNRQEIIHEKQQQIKNEIVSMSTTIHPIIQRYRGKSDRAQSLLQLLQSFIHTQGISIALITIPHTFYLFVR